MDYRWKALISGLFFLLLLFNTACIPSKRFTVAAVGSILEDIARSSSKQSDISVIREGTPAYLMLIDGLIETYPQNEQLLVAGAQAYSAYAALFPEREDRDKAKRLYLKGRQYGLRALSKRGQLKELLHKPLDQFEPCLKGFGKKDVPALFWTASCWGSWISLSTDSVEAMAEIPKVLCMMQRVLELDEGFYYGGPHLFLAVYHLSRPKAYGGNPEKARSHFKKAFEMSQEKFLMGHVLYAKYYARQTFDRELFVSTLEKALEAPADAIPELTLLNTMAKQQAKRLLEEVDDYF
ncbi:MAG: TRAP transporter TatT component family protein [Syntrophobacterales bacterium]|nr:MAG: TRAP transporter TatT component family protein [Syntrophobacterales bacterium]